MGDFIQGYGNISIIRAVKINVISAAKFLIKSLGFDILVDKEGQRH